MASELVPTPATDERPSAPQLWTAEPEERLAAATRIAKLLAPVIERQRLYVTIQNRRYVLHEGWTTLAALAGLWPYVVATGPTPDGDGWWARVEVRRLDGTPVAAAEAECRRDEPGWQDRPSYALRSMAQTRASSKALRLCLGWIMTLAGYEPTPAEEMTPLTERQQTRRASGHQRRQPTGQQTATPAQQHVGASETAQGATTTATQAAHDPRLERLALQTAISTFWETAREQGYSRATALEQFGIDPSEGARGLLAYAQQRARETGKTAAQVINEMAAALEGR